MLIGVFGGTFDPVHNGHLAVAEAAIERFGLDTVYLVPNITPPHKHSNTIPYHHRFAMVALAAQSEEKMVPKQLGQSCYALSEIGICVSQHPKDTIFYIMGMDSLLDLPNWYRVDILLKYNIEFVVSHRPGYEFDQDKFNDPFYADLKRRLHFITQVQMPISATDIRTAILRDEPISKFILPPSVLSYIEKTGLYLDGAHNG